ncbi:MAG TPA: hypothetical protein VGG61_01915, partial [Gemmataceae bacterium]
MVRSIWRRTVLGVLASTGLAWGQQAAVPSAPVADTVGRIITVTEMGKPGQKCKILREWKMADGSVARQVEDVATGEKMTIVETGVLSTSVGGPSGASVKSVASRIFHWGRSEAAPAGTPLPPPETPAPALVAKPAAVEKKITEPVAPPPPARNTAQNVAPAAPASPYSSNRSTSGSEKNTVVLPAPGTPSIAKAKDPTPSSYTMIRPTGNQAPALTSTTGPSTDVTQTPVQPAQPSDWRKSWGRLPERAKTDDSAKTTAKSDATPATTKADTKPTATKNDATPKAKVDPLTDPVPRTKVAVEEKVNEKMNPAKVEVKPASMVVKATPDALPALPPLPPLDKPAPLPPPAAPPTPIPTSQPTVRVEATPAAPVVTSGVPVVTRPSLRHEKATTSVMPAPEPVGRVMVQNNEDPMMATNAQSTQHLLRILKDSIYP